ncbi:MAG TPA: hypothetical protein P5175_02985 [Anaerohalosphaeraceae bacterium]|nr:hypothetical protein [Anaerohalosphaeraceae bacterium]HPC63613.1 hypothetical protein [Anaerohalosphaeraceae bacterium]HRS70795.1 hypothetical protein [Anaerohalosphaeraceae bacterium]HRV19787.1 hypothetical protein [Anaerohalosphaeraceae bacterium]
MTRMKTVFVVYLLTLHAAASWGQLNTSQPHIGYLYPAGAKQGSTVLVTAGGQFLRGADAVYISGQGVQGRVIRFYRPLGNLQKEQRNLLGSRLDEVRRKRIEELTGKAAADDAAAKPSPQATASEDKPNKEAPPVQMPEHPLLYKLEQKNLRELAHIRSMLFFPRTKLQQNRQISETVLLEITAASDAPPGRRELRLSTSAGLTDPITFEIGTLQEVRELEPNNRQPYPPLPDVPDAPAEKPLELPVLINGQIMPGDVDRFCFTAPAGMQLVAKVHARSLIPYLADAVPGWFQAVIKLYDSAGRELVYADDYSFNPDPVLFFTVPRSGEYELEIRDSLYRGREDFVYRIAVGPLPFITQIFPLGAREGESAACQIKGWNLPADRMPLDTSPCAGCIRQLQCQGSAGVSNEIPYAVGTLPECTESLSTLGDAQPVELPVIVNGQIEQAGRADIYCFDGLAGQEIAIQVCARQLHSPLDSLIRLTDASGKVLAWNDDFAVWGEGWLFMDSTGLLTHQADSYVTAVLSSSGTYYVHLSDAQQHGGAAYGYRLRISGLMPDFAVRMTPSSLTVPAGGVAAVRFYALRTDGFEGEIEIVLKDAPAGFEISGGRIPQGRNSVWATLSAPARKLDKPVSLRLDARARIGGSIITRPVVPAEDRMQAFLYRHLLPSQELLAAVPRAGQRMSAIKPDGQIPMKIPAGGSTEVKLKLPPRLAQGNNIQLALHEPPAGLTLQEVKSKASEISFVLKADRELLKEGFADNLLVEAYTETPAAGTGSPAAQKQRISMGAIPAIPFEIIPP